MKLTYIDSGATGDPYTGLDRFGRVIDQRWQKGTTKLERLEYTYSRLGNRTERKNTEGSDLDEKYTYDGLYRLDDMERGTLDNGSITDKKFAQDWGYDALGNWKTFKQDDDGTGWDLNQTRDHTKANEIEKIDAASSVISHDPAGNITKSPRPGNWSGTFDYTWDAWNRLVAVTARGTNIAFAYDGEHKRITKTSDGITRHFYYSVDWQILEERLDEETEPLRQYVWNPNPGRMDDLVLRDEGAEGSGSSSSGGLERLYALNDLMNVTAIVDDDGNVVERYGYTPFGESRVMDGSFGPRSSSNYDWELRYKTYPLDLESGLYQVRFRYLHSGLGRWMSRDPIGYRGGLNLYGFVGNDGVNGRDYLGLSEEENGEDNGQYISCSSPIRTKILEKVFKNHPMEVHEKSRKFLGHETENKFWIDLEIRYRVYEVTYIKRRWIEDWVRYETRKFCLERCSLEVVEVDGEEIDDNSGYETFGNPWKETEKVEDDVVDFTYPPPDIPELPPTRPPGW